MAVSQGVAETPSAAAYLQSLSDHWRHVHRFAIGAEGEVSLVFMPTVMCRMWVEPGRLAFALETADSSEMALVERFVSAHLARAAVGEPGVRLTWTRIEPASADEPPVWGSSRSLFAGL
jgi:hypothetical protein